jgi:hypothetical protein
MTTPTPDVLATIQQTLGVPNVNTLLSSVPSSFLVGYLQRLSTWGDWLAGLRTIFPTAVAVKFAWDNEYDDEGGYYTTIDWGDTKVLDESGTNLIDAYNTDDDWDDMRDRLEELASDIGSPDNYALSTGLDLRKPPIYGTREFLLSQVTAWRTFIEQLPDDAFAADDL